MCHSCQIADTNTTEIAFNVEGLPPAKNTSRSIFSPKNPTQFLRTLKLLERMEEALHDSQWDSEERRPVGLELVINVTPDGNRGDATNFLGGVADVLQANRRNVDLSNLGRLASTSLYYDDKGIREARCSVKSGSTKGYRVRVWMLE